MKIDPARKRAARRPGRMTLEPVNRRLAGDDLNYFAENDKGRRRSRSSPGVLEFRLESLGTKLVFMAALVVIGACLMYGGGKEAIVEHFSDSVSALSLGKGIALDPDNAALHYRLGTIYMLSMEEHDHSRALLHLRRATELNPHNGRYWLRLATVWERTGDTSRARAAIEHALKLRPMSPEFWWAAANFELREGDRNSAWEHFRRLLQISPGYAETVFRLCYLAAGEPDLVFSRVLTPRASPALRLSYIDFLSRQGEYDAAFRLWQQTMARATPRGFEFSQAEPYLNRLLTLDRTEEAQSVWNDLGRLGIVPQLLTTEDRNAVFNGDFEQPLLNAGFDWRTEQPPYVVIDAQASDFFQGRHGLRVDFTVQHNGEYELLYQLVPVLPDREYRLEAQVRSEGITSDSGPRLRVLDFAAPANLDVSTRPVLGTTDWHPISLDFVTGPDTRIIRLALWRPRSRTYPMEVSGTFWMDAVSLRAMGPRESRAVVRPIPLP